jgi:hypothetical protein
MTRRHVSLIVPCILVCACSSSVDRWTDAGPDIATDMPGDHGGDVPLEAPDTADIPHDSPADDGGSGEHGECSSSADCDGRPCVRVPDEPGGYWMCEDPRWEEATECSSPYPDIDECCTTDDCTGGGDVGCFYVISPWGICGGPPPMPHNMCLSDECATASDCSGYENPVCLPRHVLDWPRTRCASGTCRVASDCTAETGGFCAPVHDHCCPSGIQGFFCIYPGACLTHEDCDESVCLGDWETGATTCPDVPPPCPA